MKMFGGCIVFLLAVAALYAQNYSLSESNPKRNEIVRDYINPVRIVWQTGKADGSIQNLDQLLEPGNGQADLSTRQLCVLQQKAVVKPSFLLDFGKELHGGVQLVTGRWADKKPVKIRVRFGESVSEAMSEIGEKGATNDHAMRDYVVELPWLGSKELGNTGFRFVRIDLLDPDAVLHLKEVRAIAVYRDIPWLGSFKSSDERLNKIWQTGAYTVHLNMQEYLWDGIKRDRLVWVGDMHPEVAAIKSVFGRNEVVPKSLDLVKEITPLPGWMNGISTYSMWWAILQYDWYMYTGDLQYLKQQHDYLKGLLNQLVVRIGVDGREKMDGGRFLDWPSSKDTAAIHAGLQAMTVRTVATIAKLAVFLKDQQMLELCKKTSATLAKYVPPIGLSKQAAALMALAGLISPVQADKEVLSVGGPQNFSTFYGYYMLQAQAAAGNYQAALNNIREYWGAMLDLGATTFWEDFNLDWLPNAARIDELVPAGKKDIHGDYGDYCYVGHRHSLCHGWASGPTAWLTEHVLGINITEPGCQQITIAPNLGGLSFAEGTFPTPKGVLWVKHIRLPGGGVSTVYKAPEGIVVKVEG